MLSGFDDALLALQANHHLLRSSSCPYQSTMLAFMSCCDAAENVSHAATQSQLISAAVCHFCKGTLGCLQDWGSALSAIGNANAYTAWNATRNEKSLRSREALLQAALTGEPASYSLVLH